VSNKANNADKHGAVELVLVAMDWEFVHAR